MNTLMSYCGLIDAKIRASDKDLPVPNPLFKGGLISEVTLKCAKTLPLNCLVFYQKVEEQ